MLLPNIRQVSKIGEVFVDNYSGKIKLSKTHLSKIVQQQRFIWGFLGPLLKPVLSLMKNVFKPLVKRVLI